MGRIHPVSNLVAFDNNGGSRTVAWFGDRRLYQRGADPNWETVAVDANQQAEPLRPFGALGVKGGALTWHTRINIGGVPILASPIRAMDKQVGYEGAVAASADVSVTLDLEKEVAHVWAGGAKARSISLPGGVAGGGDPWVDQFGEWLAVSCFVPQPRLTLVRLDTGEIITPTCMTPTGHYTPACVTVGGIVWVVYHTDKFGLVIHPAADPTRRKILAPPPVPGGVGIYGVDVCLINGNVEVIWFVGQSETRNELRGASITTEALLALPSVPVPVILQPPAPPVERPNGPMGPAEPVGTVVNVAAEFFALDGRAWPRGNKAKGDTHGMDYQAVTHFGEACLWECKFDTDGKGRLGELLSIDMGPDGQPDPKGHIHWRADCSDAGDPGALNPDGTVKRAPREAFVDLPSDTRWLRNVMQVGREHGLDLGDHILRKVRRRDGSLIREVSFNREMWLEALWRRYWMNPWGEVELLVYVYNNTGFRVGRGNGDPATWVERYWQARKRMPDGSWMVIAWGDWGSDQSSVVFAGGGTAFPIVPGVRSSFWHLGGQRFAPDLPPFRMPVAIPPPVVVPPPPVVVPPPPPPPPVPPVPPTVPPMTDPLATLHNEAIASAVVTAYRTLLKREPDASGYAAFVARLTSGNVTVAAMEDEIRASDEYKALMNRPTLIAPVLTIVGKEFRNGSALWVPRMVSGLTLLVRTPAEQAAFLDWAVQTGFNGVRVFAGALTWAGQTPAGARAALPALLDMATAHGLSGELACLTDSGTGYDCQAHLDGIGAIVAGRKNVICEVWNEYLHATQRQDISVETSVEWGRRYFGARGILWAVGAASVDEPDRAGVYPTAGGDYITSHLDRGRAGVENVRRIRELKATTDSYNCPVIDNERMGADEKDGSETGKQRWNDPALFFAAGALDRCFCAGGVHHSQAGLYATLPGPVQQQCADAEVAGQAAVDAVLVGINGQYQNIGNQNGEWPDSPVRNTPYGDQAGARIVRGFSFVAGNQGVTVILGMEPGMTAAQLGWANGWRLIRTVATRTAQDGRQVAVLEIGR